MGGEPADYPALRVFADGAEVLDQRALPHTIRYMSVRRGEEMVEAIRTLAIRGAPAIGVAGAYGMWLFARQALEAAGPLAVAAAVAEGRQQLLAARPTAVNLAAAVDAVWAAARSLEGAAAVTACRQAADRWWRQEQTRDQRVIQAGLNYLRQRFRQPLRILTHCHTGALATAGRGTALGIVVALAHAALVASVVVDETRPLLQGARLTAWELERAGVPYALAVDGAAASFLARGLVDVVLVGADRIARNGDTANKIGTLGLALAARYFGVPFMVAAPLTTVDVTLADGSLIPVEMRPAAEVRQLGGQLLAPPDAPVWNPAFDVTPAECIEAWITDRGVVINPAAARPDARAFAAASPPADPLLSVDFVKVVQGDVGFATDS